MPKGIRKACANCIKARLACDEGRPCQRCVVHQCECVAVARKPRVKKQRLDLDPPASAEKNDIPSIDINTENNATPNWAQSEFNQITFRAFPDRRNSPDNSPYDAFASSPGLMSPAISSPRLSPSQVVPSSTAHISSLMPSNLQPPSSPQLPSPSQLQLPSPSQMPSPSQLGSPVQQLASPPRSPLPPQLPSPPQVPLWANMSPSQVRQLQASFAQQFTTPQSQPIPLSLLPQLLQQQQQQQQQQQLQQQVQQYTDNQNQQAAHYSQRAEQLYEGAISQAQMLSLLLEEKPSTLLQDWTDVSQLGNYLTGSPLAFGSNHEHDKLSHKKSSTPPAAFQQPKNSTPLFPAPIAVFDKQKFQLLDANTALAAFLGYASVADFATAVITLDDLIDPAAAHIAKQAYTYFVADTTPFFRLGVIRTTAGTSKTVEFHVDLTEQLLIFTIKSVFDECSLSLPDPIHKLATTATCGVASAQCSCKACEFLSPID